MLSHQPLLEGQEQVGQEEGFLISAQQESQLQAVRHNPQEQQTILPSARGNIQETGGHDRSQTVINVNPVSVEKKCVVETLRPSAIQDYSDFIYSAVIGYLVTQGIDKLYPFNTEELIGSTILYTVLPYYFSRLIDYTKEIMVNADKIQSLDIYNIASRLGSSGFATGAAILLSKAGIFKNFTTYDTMALGTVGMLAGKCSELILERGFSNRRNSQ